MRISGILFKASPPQSHPITRTKHVKSKYPVILQTIQNLRDSGYGFSFPNVQNILMNTRFSDINKGFKSLQFLGKLTMGFNQNSFLKEEWNKKGFLIQN
jgi:hypothetical protein